MNMFVRPVLRAVAQQLSRPQHRGIVTIERSVIYGLFQNFGTQPNIRESLEFRQVAAQQVGVNGVTLHYDITGTGNNVILCLPGALGSAVTDFKFQLTELNKEMFTVVGLDPRGYGRSIPPQRDWPDNFIERDAIDAAQLMKNLGFSKYSVMGWSDGGIAGLMLAARYPDNVDNLVVFGANAYVTDAEVAEYEKLRDIDNWSEAMRAPFIAMYGEDYLRKQMGQWIDAYQVYLKKHAGDICRADLSKIRCPTLVLHGAKDALVPAHHPEFLVKHIKNARLSVYPEGKHNIHQRFYKKFNSDVSHFILTS
jgi:valacyclovir hydrolase